MSLENIRKKYLKCSNKINRCNKRAINKNNKLSNTTENNSTPSNSKSKVFRTIRPQVSNNFKTIMER